MENSMVLLGTEKLGNEISELTFLIKGQDALTVEQLFAIEKLYINWNRKTFKMWLAKKILRSLNF